MSKIEQRFRVAQPPTVVWVFPQDVTAGAECMPGVEQVDNDTEVEISGVRYCPIPIPVQTAPLWARRS